MSGKKQILPIGWIETTLGEICNIQIGGTPNRGTIEYWDLNKETNNLWVSISDMRKKFIEETDEYISDLGVLNSNVKLVPEGTLLMSFKLSIGKLSWAKQDLFTNEAIAALLNPKINARFLYYGLQTWDLLAGVEQAVKGATLNKEKLKNVPVYYPIDSKEQENIVNIISEIEKSIEFTQQLIEKYKKLKNGLRRNLLKKGIDRHWQIRTEETHEFKDSPIGRIPVEWQCGKIGELYDLKSGITPLRSNKEYFDYDGYNWVKTLDLNEGFIYSTEEKISQIALEKTSISLMPINTILIAMYGGWEQIGRTAILKKESATNQAITSLYNPKVDLHEEYVQFVLQEYRYKWKKFAVSTRKDPNITKKDIEEFIIVYPSDIVEQKRIAKEISSINEVVKANELNLIKLQRKKIGLMKDLLTGKVRVSGVSLEDVVSSDNY